MKTSMNSRLVLSWGSALIPLRWIHVCPKLFLLWVFIMLLIRATTTPSPSLPPPLLQLYRIVIVFLPLLAAPTPLLALVIIRER
ncbi:hypothetical protein Goklo_004073 [Gossypium klotzschianum]|uniref:Uncharacterized protein n=2 Tax=Gossypium TaxID=3633 RepID=A0A7J8VMG1_9ROSI|nr:hypothetical protein [Gossypium klotzschianum]